MICQSHSPLWDCSSPTSDTLRWHIIAGPDTHSISSICTSLCSSFSHSSQGCSPKNGSRKSSCSQYQSLGYREDLSITVLLNLESPSRIASLNSSMAQAEPNSAFMATVSFSPISPNSGSRW